MLICDQHITFRKYVRFLYETDSVGGYYSNMKNVNNYKHFADVWDDD